MKTPALKNDDAAPTGAFINLLQTKTGGVSLGELDDGLQDIVAAVKQTARPGVLTLKIKITPNGKGVKIEDELTLKEPKPTRGVSFAFVGDNGELLRNDPDQMTMQLQAVPDKQEPPRAVAQS